MNWIRRLFLIWLFLVTSCGSGSQVVDESGTSAGGASGSSSATSQSYQLGRAFLGFPIQEASSTSYKANLSVGGVYPADSASGNYSMDSPEQITKPSEAQ